MIGNYVQYVVWEYDAGFNDEIYRSGKLKIPGDTCTTGGFTITENLFKKGIDFGKADADYDKQNYFLEIITLDSTVESKKFGLSDKAKQMKVESGRSPAIVREQNSNKGTCFCEVKKLYWGKFFTCEERKKIIEISARLLCDPNYLTSAMALETGGTFDPSIVNSLGYTGLIQIGSTAATDINRRKGTNVSAGKSGNLKNMSKLEQLTYVEYYLEPFKGKLNTLADFYLAILMPIDCGKGAAPNFVVFDKNLALDYNSKGEVIKNTKWIRQRAYAQNPVFHKEGKGEQGKTYVWEIAEEIQKWYDKGPNNKEASFSCQESSTKNPEKDKCQML